jgi:hypothetical protein
VRGQGGQALGVAVVPPCAARRAPLHQPAEGWCSPPRWRRQRGRRVAEFGAAHEAVVQLV